TTKGVAGHFDLRRRRADHVRAEHRRRRLAERAGLHLLGEIADAAVRDLHVDQDARAAELGDLLRRGVGRGEAPGVRDVRHQLENLRGIEVVDHRSYVALAPCSRQAASARSRTASPTAVNPALTLARTRRATLAPSSPRKISPLEKMQPSSLIASISR